MTVSYIFEKDLNALKEVRKYSFSVGDDTVNRSLENRYTPENYLGYFEAGQLTASAEMIPFHVYFEHSVVGMGGIAWVSSFPEHRNKGHVREILRESLVLMRKRKQVLSFLGPFSYEFYRRMGWGLSFTFYELTVDMRLAPQVKTGKYRLELYRSDRLDDLIRLYDLTQSAYNGPILRDDKLFEKRLHNRYCYLFLSPDGELKGYMIYDIQGDTFKVFEMIATDIGVRKEMLSFAGKHSAQSKQIQFNTLDRQDIFLFAENSPNRYTLKTSMQARVVDVEEILKLMKPKTDMTYKTAIKVNDCLAPWNNHTYMVSAGQKLLSVTIDDDATPDMICDIDRFSQMALGAMSAKTAAEAGLAEVRLGADINALNNLFYEKPLALYDSF